MLISYLFHFKKKLLLLFIQYTDAWYDGSINNSFSSNNLSNNASSSISSNQSTNQSTNSTNFSPNPLCSTTNFNNANNLPSNLPNNLNNNNNLNSNLTDLTQNNLTANNLSNSYYLNDYVAYNSSSNSSSIAPNNEYNDFNQQNLVPPNDPNLIPSFYPTFNRNANNNNKELNAFNNNLINNNNSSINNSFNHHPSFNQPTNHSNNNHFNLVQNNHNNHFARSPITNLQQRQDDNNFQFLNVDQSNSQNYTFKENIKYEDLQSPIGDSNQKELVRREKNNIRERERVHKINNQFKDLERTCILVTGDDHKKSKQNVLECAVKIINNLEEQVLVSKCPLLIDEENELNLNFFFSKSGKVQSTKK